MAQDETDLPPGVQDILARMPRDMRHRVLADYETHYAPFLAMLAGWKGAVQEHYVQAERAATARLEEQFFPLGDWKFPAQTLAVPQRPPERTTDVAADAAFTDPLDRPWLSCGEGWLQPTGLREAAVRWAGGDCIVTLDLDYLASGSPDPVLARGQLLFAAVPEEALAALARGQWWVQTPARGARPARLTRHDGYMAFEREMQTARMSQRHLDLWLPPFHPYSRKMLCLSLANGSGDGDEQAGAVPDGDGPAAGIRFVGILPAPTGSAAAALRGLQASVPWVYLNAVPVMQTALSDTIFYPPFPRVGQEHAIRLSGAPGLFAAAVRHDGLSTPATLIRLPSQDPLALEPDVQVQFARAAAGVTQVRLYHGSSGQDRMGALDAPSQLDRAPLRFRAPFPSLGGSSTGGPADRAEWARTAWHQSVLRPPLLSEGDLREILRQHQGVLGKSLQLLSAAREIVHEPEQAGAHWRSYLWPSLLAREENFGAGGAIPAPDSMPLIQRLRLTFARAAGTDLPGFLLADMADYLASLVSQYFVLSTFRVEGEVAP